MSTRAVYQPRSAARKISGADLCHHRGIAVCQQQSKTQSEAVLDDTAVSARAQLYINSAEYQPQSAKRKQIWGSCIPTAIKSSNRSRSGRRSRVDQSGISTAISSKKHIWRRCMSSARHSCMSTAISNLKQSRSGRHSRVDQSQLHINSAEHQPQSTKRKQIWRSCISTAIKSVKQCRFGRHSRVDQSGISTAISSKRHIWRRCMSPARYSCMSTGIKNLKAKPFWTTQPCRAKRHMYRDHQSTNISGADACHQHGIAMYQQHQKRK